MSFEVIVNRNMMDDRWADIYPMITMFIFIPVFDLKHTVHNILFTLAHAFWQKVKSCMYC